VYPKNYFELMAQYNQWMDSKIYEVCLGIPDELCKKHMGAFFKSINSTLNHIYYGDLTWLEWLSYNTFAPRQIGIDLYEDFNEIKGAQEMMDYDIIDWVNSLTSEKLNQTLDYVSNVNNFSRTLPIWVLATHIFNHQTHHRGQVTTLLKQLEYEPGITDIPWLPSLENYSAAE
jgi:uncharacterized damage-inducible protein DinB